MRRSTHALFGLGLSIYVMSRLGYFDNLMIFFGLFFSLLPDLDVSFKHRALLHNLFSAVALSWAIPYFSESYILSMQLSALSWIDFFATSLIAYLSHLLLDLITKGGVELFWPLSENRFRIASLRYNDPAANALLSLAGGLLIVFTFV
ncbi:MAG: metal-dependent hydrolase [Fervidicoccaceae archaeon]